MSKISFNPNETNSLKIFSITSKSAFNTAALYSPSYGVAEEPLSAKADKNEISKTLTENQKNAIIQNKLEYHFYEILEANVFRFAKISNREDDKIYKLIKEGMDV